MTWISKQNCVFFYTKRTILQVREETATGANSYRFPPFFLRKSVRFFIIIIFLIIKTLSKLNFGQYAV